MKELRSLQKERIKMLRTILFQSTYTNGLFVLIVIIPKVKGLPLNFICGAFVMG